MPKQKKAAQRRRIAILGAGPSALVAAFRLTEAKDFAERFEVTIYQQGWRAGGKCATGRDLDRSKRLYEHGIHGFLGCYYNALTVMKRVFDSLDRPKGHPLRTFDDAFHGMSGVVRYEFDEGELKKWPIFAPDDFHGLKPGPKGERPPLSECVALAPGLARMDVWMVGLSKLALGALLQAAAKTYRNPLTQKWIGENRTLPPAPETPSGPVKEGELDLRLEPGLGDFHKLLRGAIGEAAAELGRGDFADVANAFKGVAAKLFAIVSAGGGGSASARDRLRRLALLLDFTATILKGVVADKLMTKGFASIDGEDHVAWLRRHGATKETILSPLTASTPNITYQYPAGDSLRPAVMAAGAYLHWTMMTFSYMGRFIQLFEAGSGETLIAPLVEALEKRGVRFAYFHEVTALRVAKGEDAVEAVEIDVQATVKKGPFAYRPLIPVRTETSKTPLDAWPDRPLFDQLVEGKALEASGADLESFWPGWAPVGRKVLKRGEDFDDAILGVSVGALPWLTDDLAKRSRPWKKMLAESRTVMTQAMQIWINETPWALGWAGYTNDYDDYLLSANFMTQPNGQGDFSKYIPYEEWPAEHRPAALLLLCGTLPFYGEIDRADLGLPARLKAETKERMIQFLQATGGFMLPGATTAERQGYGDPFAFDFDLLHPARPETAKTRKEGAARFDDQYWRVNCNPSDHYVSTPPGSTKWRLPAHRSGFSNLFLAGDWTENGLNVGSMEGSVRSGLLAAEAALGVARADSEVIGLDPRPAG